MLTTRARFGREEYTRCTDGVFFSRAVYVGRRYAGSISHLELHHQRGPIRYTVRLTHPRTGHTDYTEHGSLAEAKEHIARLFPAR